MERPSKYEAGQRWQSPLTSFGCHVPFELIRYVSETDWSVKWDDGVTVDDEGQTFSSYSEGCDYLGGPQPSPEVPPELPGERIPPEAHLFTFSPTGFYGLGIAQMLEGMHGTTPLVPLEGKEPAYRFMTSEELERHIIPRAPQGKPHDFTDPYLVSDVPGYTNLRNRMCVACGAHEGSVGGCTPDAGWRERWEQRISDAQRAADDAMASGAHWIQTRKGTQAAQPEGRFQSHLIGAGLGVWSLRSRDGK